MKPATSYRSLLALVFFLLSGALFALTLPPHGLSYLAWAAFIPFLIAARLSRSVLSAMCAFLTAALAAWMLMGPFDTATQCGNGFFVLVGLAGVFVPVAALASFTSRRLSPLVWAIAVPCIAVITEMLVGSTCPVSPALSQSRLPAALSLSSYTGMLGVSFLLWMFQSSVVATQIRNRAGKPAWTLLAASIAILAVFSIPHSTRMNTSKLAVAAVQADDSRTAREETSKLAGCARIVVWPEQLLSSRDKNPYRAAHETNVYVVADVPEINERGKSYNSAIVISPEGKKIGTVRKHHLFGKEVFLYTPGISRPILCGDTSIGVAICYDTAYNDVTKNLVKQGAQVIFVPTGDPVVRHDLFNRIHGAMIAFRAAECGVPIVWADGHGLSTIFDSRGKAIARAPIGETASVRGVIALRGRRKTVFVRVGEYFTYICMAGALLSLGMSLFRRSKSGTYSYDADHRIVDDRKGVNDHI